MSDVNKKLYVKDKDIRILTLLFTAKKESLMDLKYLKPIDNNPWYRQGKKY